MKRLTLTLSSAFDMWQVRLKPDSKATVTNRVIDVLLDRWTTTWQCVRHRFNRITTCPQSKRAGEGGSNYIASRCSDALAAATPVRLTGMEFSRSFHAERPEPLPNDLFVCRYTVGSRPACDRRPCPGLFGALRF